MTPMSRRRGLICAAQTASLAVAAAVANVLIPLPTQAKEAPMNKPTIVLVHGAFADATSWNGVTAALLSQGYPVIAVANPLRSLRGDATYVGNLLSSVAGNVILVGHSYGGAVISNAAVGKSNVKALVFVAAFAPDSGESALQLSKKFPGSTLGETLAAPVLLADGGKDFYIQQALFPAQFAADVPARDAQLMAAGQRPVTEAALVEPSGAPAWKTIASWFIYGSADRNVPLAALSFMAQRAGSRRTEEVKGASHVVMTSHPGEVASLIAAAAESVSALAAP